LLNRKRTGIETLRSTGALHLAVILGVDVRLLTALLPWLRELLGLEPLTMEMFTLVTATTLLTWGMAGAYSRLALAAYHTRRKAA